MTPQTPRRLTGSFWRLGQLPWTRRPSQRPSWESGGRVELPERMPVCHLHKWHRLWPALGPPGTHKNPWRLPTRREPCRLTPGSSIIPASPRVWAACRAVRRPKGGVTPPTPRWSAQGNPGRRSCRWQPRCIRESLRSPSRRWSRRSDRNEMSAHCRFRPSASTQ